MIYQIEPPFASLCPVAGVVPKAGLMQLFPTLLATVCHRGPGRMSQVQLPKLSAY